MTDTRMNPDDIPVSITRLVYTAPKVESYRPSGELSQNQAAEMLAHYWPAIEQHIRTQIIGDECNPSSLVLDARAYRHLADGISSTMADQNEWDGDDAEEEILLRYVRHLAARTTTQEN